MLLVITLAHDRTLDLVTQHITSSIVRIDIDQNPMGNFTYEWNGDEFQIWYNGVNLSEVTTVWYRIAYLTYLKEAPGSYDMLNRLCREEMVHQLAGMLTNAFWVSNPYKIRRAENKMLQLKIAESLGLHIPKTLVTSSATEVERFRAEIGDIIVKPVAKQVIRDDNQKFHAIFTTRIPMNGNVDFSLLASSPAIFQEEIQREVDIRTVVVGDKVFSISIEQIGGKTGDVDYRDGKGKDLVYKPHRLPENIEKAAVRLVRAFGLEYSAMDFILGKDGIYYFLESNPCGAWVFVQNGGNYPIAECLAKLLS